MAKVMVTIDPKTAERKYEIEGIGGVACDEITRALQASNETLEHQYTSEHSNPDVVPNYNEE